MRLCLALGVLLATAAVAAPKKPVVVVSAPPSIVRLLGKELARRYALAPVKAPLPPQPTAKEVREVTGPLAAVAVILVQTTSDFITIRVLSGADGTPLDTIAMPGNEKRPPRALAKADLASLLAAVGAGQAPGAEVAPPTPPPAAAPPPAPPPALPTPAPVTAEVPRPAEPAPAPPPVVAERPAAPATPSGRPTVRAYLGFGGFNRQLTWVGNTSDQLGESKHLFSGAVSASATLFPGASFTDGVLSNLGLFVGLEQGVGMASQIQGTTVRYASWASRLRFGAVWRLPVVERFDVSVHAGYARQEMGTAATATDGTPRPHVPDVLFNGFRGGLGLRLRLVGSLELEAGGGVQAVAHLGELASARFFPHATALAADAGGALSLELVPNVRLRVAGEWGRYFITTRVGADDPFVATGGADQYLSASGGLLWSM